MQTFIARRLLIGVVILFVLSVTVFILLSVVPGDPAKQRCGLGCKDEQIKAIRHELGLDKPRFPDQRVAEGRRSWSFTARASTAIG